MSVFISNFIEEFSSRVNDLKTARHISLIDSTMTLDQYDMLIREASQVSSIHILNNFNDESLSPWYLNDFGAELNTPEWTFSGNALKEF